MGNVCKGGLYDGRPANALEDRNACVENGGSIGQDSSQSCTLIHAAGLGLGLPGPVHKSLLAELVVLPLRLVRNSLPQSSTIAAIENLNNEMAEDLARILSVDPELASEVASVVLDASYFAGSMLQGGNSIFASSFHERIAKVSERLIPHLRGQRHDAALAVMAELEKMVGKSAGEVYATLKEDHGRRRD